MRGRPGRTRPTPDSQIGRVRLRGESRRVAERVRGLLAEPDSADVAGDSDEVIGADRRGDRPPAVGPVALMQRIAERLPIRIDPGRRTALAVGIAVLVAAIVTGAWVAAARPRNVPVSASIPSLPGTATPVGSSHPSSPRSGPGSSSASGSAQSAASGAPALPELVVDVAGKVVHPGLYHLPVGARIDDAVRAAGGPLHGVDLSSLNLAAKIVDGQQILVGAPAAAGTGGSVGSGAGGSGAGVVGGGNGAGAGGTADGSTGGATPGGPVSLNAATLEQLQTLPGVGPVLAQHIIDYRTEHGSFTAVDQLNDVSGIGEVKYAALRALVTV